MTNNQDQMTCTRNCWLMGAVAGLVFAAVFYVIGDYRLIQAVFAGVVIAVILGLLLGAVLCSKTRNAPDASATRADTSATTTTTTTAAASASSAATTSGDTMPSGFVSNVPHGQPAAAPEPKAEKKPEAAKKAGAAKKPAAKKPAAKKPAAAKPAKASAAAAKPARKAVAADGKPDLLKSARAGGADDLKLISGVGPKLEQTLNEMGIWHFDQVAGWRKKEIEWVDERLRFKGRIERDDWISQAKILAKGGETEFSRKKKT